MPGSRLLKLGALICGVAGPVVGQCPVQLRHASLDASTKSLSIRYYNAGRRVVRGVQFALVERGLSNGNAPVASYSVEGSLYLKHETTTLFKHRLPKSVLVDAASTGLLEVQVTRLVFNDLSTWSAPAENPCTVSVSRQ
jgi:hypothetical protein